MGRANCNLSLSCSKGCIFWTSHCHLLQTSNHSPHRSFWQKYNSCPNTVCIFKISGPPYKFIFVCFQIQKNCANSSLSQKKKKSIVFFFINGWTAMSNLRTFNKQTIIWLYYVPESIPGSVWRKIQSLLSRSVKSSRRVRNKQLIKLQSAPWYRKGIYKVMWEHIIPFANYWLLNSIKNMCCSNSLFL